MYQLLKAPKDREFEIDEFMREHGVNQASDRQYSYARQWLTMHGFVQSRIQGRREFWVVEARAPDPDVEKLCSYTPETFAAKFFPGLVRPLSAENFRQMVKIMKARGLVQRAQGHWSYKAERREYKPRVYAKASPPKYVRIPRHEFTLIEFLEANGMRRYPENFEWARAELARRGIKKTTRSKFAQPTRRGTMSALITESWELPRPQGFTTHEFQRWNGAMKPTGEQWASAILFLEAQGLRYDGKWRRWVKK